MSETYRNFQTESITWRGVNATYSLAEIDEIEGLPAREAWVIHMLKSLGGEIGAFTEGPSVLGVVADTLRPGPPAGVAASIASPQAHLTGRLDHKKGLVPRKRNEPLPGSISLF